MRSSKSSWRSGDGRSALTDSEGNLARLNYLLEKIASKEPAPASGSACAAVVGATLAAAAAESGRLLIEVNLGDAEGDARFAVASKLARKASGLALSLRPRDS